MKTLLAVGQMTATENVEKNFEVVEALVNDAKQRGAQFLSLPENFAFFADNNEDTRQIAEPLDGPLFSRYCALAKRHQIWLSAGGFPEKANEEIFNTHAIIDAHGKISATYRKVHLFALDMPHSTQLDESQVITPGNKLVIAKSPVGKLGLSICYDLRFSGLYWALAEAGAEISLVPSAFTETTGKIHWEILLRSRAIETQSYVAAAAQTGVHNAKRRSHGHAMIVDPWGTVLAQCGEGTGIACAEIDIGYLKTIRARMPVFKHRRPDVYQAPILHHES